MRNSHPLFYCCLSVVLLGTIVLSAPAHSAPALISSTEDYLAISVEAEDFESSEIDTGNDDDRWILTDPTTPQTEQDSDSNNSDGAVGQKYLELLPDIRVTHNDAFSPPIAFWGSPGAGPTLKYDVDFPEPGRYYLHVRMNSSGTEDNGVHAGLNEDWPDSSARVQSCSGGQGWVWTSRQRGDGTVISHCGADFTLWLDVPERGVNTVKFSAREDGFELDRFTLIKDKSDNTRICRPSDETGISCRDGSLETADDFTDVAIHLEVDRTAGVEDDLFVFNALISNEDAYDTANQVIMESTLDLIDTWELMGASDVCTTSGQLIQCLADELEPTAPDEDLNIEFTLRAKVEGDHTVVVDVTTTSMDENETNDSSSVEVSVLPLIAYATIESRISRDLLFPTVADTIRLTVALENISNTSSENTTVTINLPAGLQFVDSNSRCANDASDQLVCNIGSLEAHSSQAVSASLEAELPGFYPVTVSTGADSLEEGSFSSTYIFEVVEVEDTTEAVITDPDTEQNITDVDITDVTNSGRDSESPEEEGDSSVSEEVGVVAQTSGGGATLWSLLMLISCYGFRRRSGQSAQ